MPRFNWTCPYCNTTSMLEHGDDTTTTRMNVDHGVAAELYVFHAITHRCPNPSCNEFTLTASLFHALESTSFDAYHAKGVFKAWNLVPQSKAIPMPDYIPQVIRDDYDEACTIASLSPKASATLSRRALQGMIRDFWSISKGRLIDEINALEDKVEPDVWSAIDGVRSVGNIGAHMEKDINVIIEVDEDEADLLIGLIELLAKEWYIARKTRQNRLAKITQMAEDKKKKPTPEAEIETENKSASTE